MLSAKRKIDSLKKGDRIRGLVSDKISEIISVEPQANRQAYQVIYRTDGKIDERLIPSDQELYNTSLWTFDADPKEFKIASEAYRIQLAHLFDPYIATHNSDIIPLPHQIIAVYKDMMGKQPLRFILADDPGAGKTIMAGLFIKELMIRSDVKRCLIITPGNLSVQWKLELEDKFQLDFEIFEKNDLESTTKNPFEKNKHLICRIDQIARNDNLLQRLKLVDWDLVIVDEAHKMSANFYGNKLKKTKRYRLGEMLSEQSRHFLLMTATPHNGKKEDFELFLSLLDRDRFYYYKGLKIVDDSDNNDLIIKRIKEDLLDFDEQPLFPKRESRTAKYMLSSEEMNLYEKVTEYVRKEMNKADKTDRKRSNTIGFALTILQRRLASSPAAIHQSLERRIKRLENEISTAIIDQPVLEVDDEDSIDEDSLTEKEIENLLTQTTASNTIEERRTEIEKLKELKKDSETLLKSENDVKWNKLSECLEEDSDIIRNGKKSKLVIFTENKDTLKYLERKLKTRFGNNSIVSIHGGVSREERLKVEQKFKSNKETFILLGTDAAGEGINLQCANFVLNYDIPWNPNRIEQRFGRVHRIGQKKICYLFNFVAENTREGLVFDRLLSKISSIKKDLGNDKIFDILGEIVSEGDMRDLLIKAIRSEDEPNIKENTNKKIDSCFNMEKIKKLQQQHSLIEGIRMKPIDVVEIKHAMEKAKARKLQPHFISSFFEEAMNKFLGGKVTPIESRNLFNVQVPKNIVQYSSARGKPVIEKYDVVTFNKELNKDNEFLYLGHPLIDSTVELILKGYRASLDKGTVFIDTNDFGDQLKVMVMLEHCIKVSGSMNDLSRKMIFINIFKNGKSVIDSDAPYIDLSPIDKKDEHIKNLIKQIKKERWIKNIDKHAIEKACEEATKHSKNIKKNQNDYINRTLSAVQKRLDGAILSLESRASKEKNDLQKAKLHKQKEDLQRRKENRIEELQNYKEIHSYPPNILGRALIIPQGYINKAKNNKRFIINLESRTRIEKLAMDFVMKYEKNKGHQPKDVSKEKNGWDIESMNQTELQLIEVKGLAMDTKTVTITRNEILKALNSSNFILFIVKVDNQNVKEAYRLDSNALHGFLKNPRFAEVACQLDVKKIIKRSQKINL